MKYGNDLKTLQELRDKSKGETKEEIQKEIDLLFLPPKPRKKKKKKNQRKPRREDF